MTTTPAAIVRAARTEITATPADAIAIWERYAADLVAAEPGLDASDAAYAAWERATASMDRLGARIGAI